MCQGWRVLVLSCSLFLVTPDPVSGQYIYLDANGNGVHDSGDVLNPSAPTTLNIWLDTAHNRDGSQAVVLSRRPANLE